MNAKLDQEIASASPTTTTDQCGANCDGRDPVRLCAPVDGAKGLRELVERILSLPPVPVLVHGEAVAVRGSIGAVPVEPEDRLDQALRRADVAVHDHKRSDDASLLIIG